MIRINLIPYRAERRQAQILQHLGWAVGVLLAVVVLLFLADSYIKGQLSDLKDEYTQIRAQNAELMKKIGKIKNLDKLRAEVERKLALVDRLQEGRFESLITLNALAEVIPENVWLSSVSDNAGNLSFTGYGESNKAVANFMRALDKSPVFDDIALKVISRTREDGTPIRSFKMTLKRTIPSVDKKGGKQ
jgi:type IV pilus assembly protein PilN